MIYSSKLLKDKDKKKNLLDFNRYYSNRCQESSQKPFISITPQSNLNVNQSCNIPCGRKTGLYEKKHIYLSGYGSLLTYTK